MRQTATACSDNIRNDAESTCPSLEPASRELNWEFENCRLSDGTATSSKDQHKWQPPPKFCGMHFDPPAPPFLSVPPPPPSAANLPGVLGDSIPPPPSHPRLPPTPILQAHVNQWQNLPHVYSSRQLLPLRSTSQTRSNCSFDDKVVYLPVFQSRVYVTSHPATEVEFDRYHELIKYAAEDSWHQLPDAQTIAQVKALQDAGFANAHLPIVHGASPVSLEVPRVSGGAALRTSETVPSLRCENLAHLAPPMPSQMEAELDDCEKSTIDTPEELRKPLHCKRCTRSKQAALKSCGLVYITVFETVQGSTFPGSGIHQPIPTPGPSTVYPGTPIYKIARNGSRDAAASQTFYTAGLHRWSTAFTCILRSDHDWTIAADEGYARVDDLWEMADDSKSETCVFY